MQISKPVGHKHVRTLRALSYCDLRNDVICVYCLYVKHEICFRYFFYMWKPRSVACIFSLIKRRRKRTMFESWWFFWWAVLLQETSFFRFWRNEFLVVPMRFLCIWSSRIQMVLGWLHMRIGWFCLDVCDIQIRWHGTII